MVLIFRSARCEAMPSSLSRPESSKTIIIVDRDISDSLKDIHRNGIYIYNPNRPLA